MDDQKKVIAYVTVPNQTTADNIADVLLEKRLVACVNIIPGIKSKYVWNGKVETDQELLLMMKTMRSHVPQLIETVKANHGYDVPEVIVTDIKDGNPDYLDWIKSSTTPLS
eukprot:CAMPEP_0174254698 /NCGR_PEP_ID=MMETSP0439-20130205/4019_1 /TAXON_ID=0 /ORGANISM="Stereomyxa ramosa, Strain Chinc5" /LENGTH=110 /DNA_ID=CAMNT_0015336441 /DNA_START=218 /DNA_END=550 /DNA_ORIENTATION=+